MRVHVLQHVAFEGLGSIDAWLAGRQAMVTYTRFFESASLPLLDEVDFIIALGGPMSVNDEDEFPWLIDEKLFIAEAIGKNKTILGICLGCQLIAGAVGSRVYPNTEKEIGWFPVYSEQKSLEAPILPEFFEAFHWHGETFDLPAGAVLLASSAACRNQAFQIGQRVLGFQFHLEITPESMEMMIAHGRHELLPRCFVQTEQQLRSVSVVNYGVINTFMVLVLEALFPMTAYANDNRHD
ncbi:type 1 glutamine amidotransferase [Candidatus Methylobacter oryzae]|uniref:Amidotransferase n=1 Tax=Candidatus Methylobacter oryzae TaxID=2497749 RepID=A0ABY3C4K9_9GAMM|nr:type 1 glutamine amidotransferase [Candidatus Methylobacter oryzae]TRW89603.1 amidotransferase [Candidatus Methylobacter oryzae]